MAQVPESTNWSQTSGPSLSSVADNVSTKKEQKEKGGDQGLDSHSRPEQMSFLSQRRGCLCYVPKLWKAARLGEVQGYLEDVQNRQTLKFTL